MRSSDLCLGIITNKIKEDNKIYYPILMDIYNSLNKHISWSHSLSILLVINKIRPAFLLIGTTPVKLNKITKIVKDLVLTKTIEYRPKKYFTLFYLDEAISPYNKMQR